MPHQPDPDLTPTEEQVRRLLAEARHTEPMPEDVAARLDGVLADLTVDAGPSAGPLAAAGARRTPAPPADLAAARRRRNARKLLVAAAAVVAIGVGLNEVDLTVSGGDSASTATSGAEDAAGDAAGAEASQPEAAPSPADSLDGYVYGRAALRLTAARFGTQVRRLQTAGRTAALNDTTASSQAQAPRELSALRRACSTEDWGTGRFVAVRYDGDLGALVFRRVRGETQVVDLYLCGGEDPARSITLRAR
jgi:hypothetical protein